MSPSLSTLEILIVDDERIARSRLRRMLGDVPAIRVVGEAVDGIDALGKIESLSPDLVLLDIEMPDLSGLEVVRSLRVPRSPWIVIVTAFDRYAVEAFELEAVDYLLKPVRAGRLLKAIERVRAYKQRPDLKAFSATLQRIGIPFRRIAVRYRHGLKVVPAASIISARVEDKLVYARTTDGDYLTDYSLSELEEGLDSETFLRVHRQWLVNLNHIREMQPLIHGAWQLIMSNGQEVPVSRRYALSLKKRVHLS